ncbi:hypothetical protein V8C37DRAFT_375617 [Trichoderma ceciliae]
MKVSQLLSFTLALLGAVKAAPVEQRGTAVDPINNQAGWGRRNTAVDPINNQAGWGRRDTAVDPINNQAGWGK